MLLLLLFPSLLLKFHEIVVGIIVVVVVVVVVVIVSVVADGESCFDGVVGGAGHLLPTTLGAPSGLVIKCLELILISFHSRFYFRKMSRGRR